MDPEAKKLFACDGVDDGELRSFLYVDKFECASIGDTCGEL